MVGEIIAREGTQMILMIMMMPIKNLQLYMFFWNDIYITAIII